MVVSLISCIGFVFYLWILTRHPLIYGIDGPYYLIQIRSLLENQQLEYGDPPLSFFLFTFFTLLVGGDMTLGIRIGVAFFSAISAVPLYFLVRKITAVKYAGYVAMLACIFSAPHIRLMNDLLKNTLGAFFLLCFIFYLHSLAVEANNRKNLLFAMVFLVLTAATHILDFGIALLFLILYPTVVLFLRVEQKGFMKNVGILLLVILIFGAAAFLAFPSLFTDFYKGLYFLQDLFAALENQTPSIFFLFDPRGGGLILPVLSVGVILILYEWKQKNTEASLVLSVTTIVGSLLCLPFIPQEWLWRFLLMEFIPVALILGYCTYKMERKITLAIFVVLIVFPLVMQSIQASGNMGPTINETGYYELLAITDYISSNSVIVVHPRIGYWIKYVIRCDTARIPHSSLWQSYSYVFALVQKLPNQPYPIPPGSKLPPLFEGEEFVLFELRQNRLLRIN